MAQFVNEIQSALFSANPDAAAEIKNCNKKLRLINAALKNAVTIGEKQHLATSISMIKSFRKMFKALDVVGSGLVSRKEKPSDRVKWEDQQSAFKGRLRTGVVINLRHKDPTAFLNDASGLFNRRIINALKKEEALKVNAVFCGQFIVKKGDQEVFDMKFMNTKNAPIYRDTDLKEWFMVNVLQPIITQLEEFQEKDSGWALGNIINLAVNINKFTPQVCHIK